MQRLAREMKQARKRLTKERSFLILSFVAIYLFLFVGEFPILFRSADSSSASSPLPRMHRILHRNVDASEKKTVIRHANISLEPFPLEISSLSFNLSDSSGNLSKMASVAFEKGGKLLAELKSGNLTNSTGKAERNGVCRASISLSSTEFRRQGGLMVLPCGLTLGSKITVIGKPTKHGANNGPEMNKTKSQFIMELQGLRREGEYPPRIFHFNPRLYGDWSRESVIEMNTCYRMQWGIPLRCDGRGSGAEEDTVDGEVKCEKWTWGEDERLGKSKSRRILRRWIGQKKKSTDLRYPFVEDRLFVLTLTAGTQGYHVHVDGRHIISFSYRAGFAIEEATGLTLTGDIEVESVIAEALPASHKKFSIETHLEVSGQWRSPPLTGKPIDLFIGILSASNHFAERMAVRKTWMQYAKNSRSIVARFFVAMHASNEVNLQLKKEAEFFGDIVIVPFLDNYDLVVLKTIAICDYGVKRVSAKYVMKCDDDTFVRVDSVLEEVKISSTKESLYLGNINYFHSPLRDGKWAVTYEEWAGEMYPPYANGPCYVLSSDIANYIIAEFEKDTLKLFKMEDVSVGMWVEKFNRFGGVEYVHDLQYCQFGCIDDYLTAHYQSPRQMICLWDKLQAGKPECCDSR